MIRGVKEMNKKGNVLIISIVIAALAITMLLYFKTSGTILTQLKQDTAPTVQPSKQKEITEGNQLKSYTSQDLKISFKYPKSWYLDEKDFDIMVTSYQTRIGENKPPNTNEIKIFIDNYSGCFPTLEQDLVDPACGQGKAKNKIISKEVKQTAGGEFLKYTLESYDPNQRIQHFFQKGERILDIEKNPVPSQFENEFEDLVNSIRFL